MNNIQASKIQRYTTTIISIGYSDEYNHYLPLRDIEALELFLSYKFGPTVVLPDTSTLTENVTGNCHYHHHSAIREKKQQCLTT